MRLFSVFSFLISLLVCTSIIQPANAGRGKDGLNEGGSGKKKATKREPDKKRESQPEAGKKKGKSESSSLQQAQPIEFPSFGNNHSMSFSSPDIVDTELEGLCVRTEKVAALNKAAQTLMDCSLDDLLESARQNDLSALGQLGTICYIASGHSKLVRLDSLDLFEGEDVLDLAFSWLNMAYNRGDSSVEDLLAFCHLRSTGTKCNMPLALKLFRRTADRQSEFQIRSASPTDEKSRKLNVLRSLFSAATGRMSLFLNMNWITHEELETYKKHGSSTASCLLAFKQLMGLGCDANPEAGIQSLQDLARSNHVPLAKWLLGRAYLYGEGVNPDVELGLYHIFQAATSLSCPQAMLFMKHSFPLKKTEQPGKPRFKVKVQELLDKVARLEEHHESIKREDKYNDIFDCDFELSSFLHYLHDAKPGFMLSTEGLSPDLIRLLREVKNPKIMAYHEGYLTFEEENVSLLDGITSFLKGADVKITKDIEALRVYLNDIEQYHTTYTQRFSDAGHKDKDKLQKLIESCGRKRARTEEDINVLESLRSELKDLIPSTTWDRDNTFIEKYPFMEG